MPHILHFDFRADSVSSATDDVSVEAVWVDSGDARTSLGVFTSYPAGSGDAPWKTVDVDISNLVSSDLTGKLEINRTAGNDNAHIRNVWIDQQTVFDYETTRYVEYYEYIVPDDLTELTVDAYGAKGADGPGRGGYGGRVLSTIPVIPNEVLRIYVGGPGRGDSEGYNGGGVGGGLSGGGAAGGGATDIRRAPYGLADRLVVAGGGGGGGDFGHGGDGGGLAGQDGLGGGYGGTTSGKGGTQTAGGANGAGTITGGPNSGAGAFGLGGHAQWTNPGGYGQGSGGGGGGWYGGGCGGPDGWNEGASGGGGSSHTVGSYLANEQGVRNGAGRFIIHEKAPDYGEFPKYYPYIADVEDGILNGVVILNDGGSPGQEYYAETGEPIDPSAFNYSIDWTSKSSGHFAHEYDNWMDTGSRWATGFGAYQSGYSSIPPPPPWGVPTFSWDTRDWYTELRSDGFSGAPHHVITMGTITAGSRGMSDIGPIWGWNSWSDFFFALAGGHGRGGVYRMSGGVVTQISSIHGGTDFQVTHDFITGDLHVEWGGNIHYYGNHPHSVVAGHAGWLADNQDGGIFGSTTGCTSWSNVFEPGHIASKRQFSMKTLAVMQQDPLTWFFGGKVMPPLRQRSRDDGLATDARQQKGSGSSLQTSLRRGGRVYY